MKPEAVKVGKLWWIRRTIGKTTKHYEWLSEWNVNQWDIVDRPRTGEQRYFRSCSAAERFIEKYLTEDKP